MLRLLVRVALAYAAYRISREFVGNVPDIERGPLGEAPPKPRRAKRSAPRRSAEPPRDAAA